MGNYLPNKRSAYFTVFGCFSITAIKSKENIKGITASQDNSGAVGTGVSSEPDEVQAEAEFSGIFIGDIKG